MASESGNARISGRMPRIVAIRDARLVISRISAQTDPRRVTLGVGMRDIRVRRTNDYRSRQRCGGGIRSAISARSRAETDWYQMIALIIYITNSYMVYLRYFRDYCQSRCIAAWARPRNPTARLVDSPLRGYGLPPSPRAKLDLPPRPAYSTSHRHRATRSRRC